DDEQYHRATSTLKRWLDILSTDGFPRQFDGFSFATEYIVNFCSLRDLTDPQLIATLMAPLTPYFDDIFRAIITNKPWQLIGLSANYLSQLPVAIFLSRFVREIAPGCIICLGGTEISDDIKQLSDPNKIWDLFPEADYIVVGEGETALAK